eukprot:2478559-Rhodomonas_salina.1
MTADDCVFKIQTGKSILIVAIVVDDVLMIGNNEALRQKWFDVMRGHFEVSDEGELKYYLGVHYQRVDSDLIASQSGYLERVLKRYGMENCK